MYNNSAACMDRDALSERERIIVFSCVEFTNCTAGSGGEGDKDNMPLKDAPFDSKDYDACTRGDMLQIIQDLTNKAYHNRQLFEYACKDHVDDFRSVELELLRAGIPEDDGYGCYGIAERVKMLAKKGENPNG